jgi:hypothetical protein
MQSQGEMVRIIDFVRVGDAGFLKRNGVMKGAVSQQDF